jgi:hypothetical protein
MEIGSADQHELEPQQKCDQDLGKHDLENQRGWIEAGICQGGLVGNRLCVRSRKNDSEADWGRNRETAAKRTAGQALFVTCKRVRQTGRRKARQNQRLPKR